MANIQWRSDGGGPPRETIMGEAVKIGGDRGTSGISRLFWGRQNCTPPWTPIRHS